MRKKKAEAVRELAFLYAVMDRVLEIIKYCEKEEVMASFFAVAHALGGEKAKAQMLARVSHFKRKEESEGGECRVASDKCPSSIYKRICGMSVKEMAAFFAKGEYEKLMEKVCAVCGKYEREKEACMHEECIYCVAATEKVLLGQVDEEEEENA